MQFRIDNRMLHFGRLFQQNTPLLVLSIAEDNLSSLTDRWPTGRLLVSQPGYTLTSLVPLNINTALYIFHMLALFHYMY